MIVNGIQFATMFQVYTYSFQTDYCIQVKNAGRLEIAHLSKCSPQFCNLHKT